MNGYWHEKDAKDYQSRTIAMACLDAINTSRQDIYSSGASHRKVRRLKFILLTFHYIV